jgi:protein tyrosine phosphatase (PTP) superfamily phosphohydrolase (DUF442 family)
MFPTPHPAALGYLPLNRKEGLMKTEKPCRWALFVAVTVTAMGGCDASPEEEGAPSAELTTPAPTLADVQAVGIQNTAMPLDNLVTTGQPTEEQLFALVDLGYTNFISLRPPTEEGAGWEEGIASDEGIQFARIPVDGAQGLTRENVLELDRLLGQAGDEGTVVYDSSGNRVGALLALRAYWLEGADPQAALDLGRRAGLSGLEPTVSELLAAPR